MYEDNFNDPFLSAFFAQYMLALGEFGTDSFSGGKDYWIVWLLFVGSTIMSQLVILNMLIAIMGDTFDFVFENQYQMKLKLKIELMNDYVYVVYSKPDNTKFLFVATP